MKLARVIVVALMAMALGGCLAPQNVHMMRVNMRAWSETSNVVYENSDSLSLRSINIALRYNDNFSATLLPLKIAVTAPDSTRFEEVVEIKINHPRTALTVATTETLPYRDSALLSQKGTYIFAFTPLDKVRGVEAIGIEIREITE